MADLHLRTVTRTQGNNEALKDGTVVPEGFRFDFEEVPVLVQAFRRMVRGLEFDVCEMALTTYLTAKAHGVPFTAVPAFLVRGFHHSAITIDTRHGITRPKDLEGRKVGVSRGYTVTTGVWARSILQHQYGVDLGRVTWVLSGDEHVEEYRPPANVVPIEKGQKMEDLVVSGEIPAAIGVQIDSPDVKPLIPNAADAGLAALRERGLYPINHTLVVKDDLLAAQPSLAADICNAFAEAKRPYLDDLAAGRIAEPSADDRFFKRVMEVIGDPLPYGVEPNWRMLEAIIQHDYEQGIIPRRMSVEELFPDPIYCL